MVSVEFFGIRFEDDDLGAFVDDDDGAFGKQSTPELVDGNCGSGEGGNDLTSDHTAKSSGGFTAVKDAQDITKNSPREIGLVATATRTRAKSSFGVSF